MSADPIGVAVAGLGFGEKVHLPALSANPDLEAVALWHPRRGRLDQACATHGLAGYDDSRPFYHSDEESESTDGKNT